MPRTSRRRLPQPRWLPRTGDGRRMGSCLRSRVLYRWTERIEAESEDLAPLLTRENRKLLSASKVELASAVDTVRFAAGQARMWALATRFQAERDLIVVHGAEGSKLDPSADNGLSSKMGFECTVPLGGESSEYLRIQIPGYERSSWRIILARNLALSASRREGHSLLRSALALVGVAEHRSWVTVSCSR